MNTTTEQTVKTAGDVIGDIPAALRRTAPQANTATSGVVAKPDNKAKLAAAVKAKPDNKAKLAAAVKAKTTEAKLAAAVKAKTTEAKTEKKANAAEGKGLKTNKQVKATEAKPAKPAKVKAKKPAHKPADIERTDGNPAKSIVPPKFKAIYAEHGGSCGDKVAAAVTAAIETRNDDGRKVLDMRALRKIAEQNGIDYSRYEGLNNGQQSMNVRNRLRGLLKAGKKVTIGKQVFANADKALAKPAAMAA